MARIRALSPQARAVLAVLADQADQADPWRHGYDITTRAGVKSGTLYPLLMRLEAQGLLEAKWVESTQPGRPARHVYRLTATGREWVASLAEPLAEPLAAGAAAPMPLRPSKARP